MRSGALLHRPARRDRGRARRRGALAAGGKGPAGGAHGAAGADGAGAVRPGRGRSTPGRAARGARGMNDLMAVGQQLSVWFLPIVTAITLHEAAHAWVADRLGDDTARRLGRVSFNPIRHVDPFGTLVLPGMLLLLSAPFLFGWAKPV